AEYSGDSERFGNALRVASYEGVKWAVKLFLDLGADVNYFHSHDQYYYNALLAASSQGHTDVVELLLEKGADFTLTDEGWTPLMRAAANGHIDIARTLLDHGADIKAAVNQYGWTVLRAAA
ncbi:ankyrin, partial [Periconia macrospinosa]